MTTVRLDPNQQSCTLPLDGSLHASSNVLKFRCLLIMSVYTPIDCPSLDARDEFYWDLSRVRIGGLFAIPAG